VLFLLAILSTSYAVLSVKLVGERKYSLTIGTLDFKLDNEKNAIRLMNAYPMSDEEGQALTPYTFSLTNIGTLKEHYKISLVTDTKQQASCSGCEFLTPAKLRYSLNINGIVGTSKTLSEITTLDSGELSANQTKNYELRLWLRSEATIEEENKYYYGKIKVDTSQEDVQEEIVIAGHTFSVEKSTDTFPDFSQISSAENGTGIYKYTEDGEDVYYFRGAVEDNHVIFAGYCWEMVRTTKTGGVKMIYDGTPVTVDGKQTCPNTGTASQLTNQSAFNSHYKSPAGVGYMYRNASYQFDRVDTIETGTLYGNNVNWNGTSYTLKSKNESESLYTSTGVFDTDRRNIAKANHYTCLNTSGICEKVMYINYVDDKYLYYIVLTEGKTIDGILEEVYHNEQSSKIKTEIETWFENTDLVKEENLKKIEDAIYCNDRSLENFMASGWDKDGDSRNPLRHTSSARRDSGVPDLNCRNRNDNRDRFTYHDTINGNGLLKWPVGLITLDETMLAGGQNVNNSNYYLNTGEYYWMMTPFYFPGDWASAFCIKDAGYVSGSSGVPSSFGIRPVIALKSGVTFKNGTTGTEVNPYVVE